MRVVTIHQPEHLPWAGFFYKVARADAWVVLDTVQYRKNYFGNRNRLAGPGGPFWVTVPVSLKGHMGMQYREIPIAGDQPWADRYRKSVYFHYRNHPYFDTLWPTLEDLLGRPWTRLADLNEALIRFMLDAFGLHPEIVRASDLGTRGKSSEMLADLCLRTGAEAYLAGGQGRGYMEEEPFQERGIQVLHSDFEHPAWPQKGRTDFLSHLSALDLLMNCGPASRGYLSGPPGADDGDREPLGGS